jgi:hypothetical protein
MIKTITLIFGTVLIMALTGCKNTATAVGNTAQGAVHGAGDIVEGVGEGINHIGQGMKKDINDDGETTE